MCKHLQNLEGPLANLYYMKKNSTTISNSSGALELLVHGEPVERNNKGTTPNQIGYWSMETLNPKHLQNHQKFCRDHIIYLFHDTKLVSLHKSTGDIE